MVLSSRRKAASELKTSKQSLVRAAKRVSPEVETECSPEVEVVSSPEVEKRSSHKVEKGTNIRVEETVKRDHRPEISPKAEVGMEKAVKV